MRYQDELLIQAPIERVWALTLDVERWPDATPTITEVARLDDGPFGIGSQARIKQPAQSARVWTVTRLEEPVCFEWETTVGPIRLRGGHHLSAEGDGCRNRLTLDIRGFGSLLHAPPAARIYPHSLPTELAGFNDVAGAGDGPGPRQDQDAGGASTA